MEENTTSTVLDGDLTGIRFGLANRQEICTSSNSDCPISHASQLSNPFLGLPLESGKCESCGTAEPGQCEGHFGYIELPIPVYHPDHSFGQHGVCLVAEKMSVRKGKENCDFAMRSKVATQMEENTTSTVLDGDLTGIRFGLANRQEICTSSNSDCPISHASQLSNPFLGLPLESGKCESCGTAEPGQCEGHFGYIELPIPVYHPDHVSELKRILSLLCLKCLKMKNRMFPVKNVGPLERMLSSCCEEVSQISINEVKTTDGACYLELKLPSRSRFQEGFWDFLAKYGFQYGSNYSRPLLPSEVMGILKKIPEATRKKLSGKGYFPQDGYILQYVPVPPNCLSMPDVSDGISVMSSDHSITMLKKVLKQVEIIKTSRSGTPNFVSHEVEANDLQAAVAQYLQVRGTSKASRDVETRYGVSKEPENSSTKAWLEKMKTLFIRKGSGFSSRSVITGDSYKGVDEIGLPFEIAQKITFEERVNQHNIRYLQKLVDEKLCLTYKDGLSTYSLREGSKGHTFLRPGQVVHRRIMDGDIVFVNRPPTTHKHSLQALSVYIHDDHTVKINPLICGPLSADFDGDCVHIFYPQSFAAKAEVLELFSVENQLLSSHTGNFNLQMATDSLLSLKFLFKNYFLSRAAAQQLAMFVPNSLPKPAVVKSHSSGPLWTALQMLQTTLPTCFDCSGERHLICGSEILKVDFNRDVMQSIINDIVTSLFFVKGPKEVLNFFNSLQPLLMENLYSEGFSVGLEDFSIPRPVVESIQKNIQDISPLLYHLRSTYNELVELQLDNHMKLVKIPVSNFILKSSAMGHLIDSKSDSAINKVVQQIGFLGLQLSDKGKFYSGTLVGDMASLFLKKYPFSATYPSEEFGMVRSCLFHGLDPYQEMVHSISSREVIVRSSRGLTEPGTLFKNLMAILRDVVICYDGSVRNVCSNSIIQFEYGVKVGTKTQAIFAAGEPVGVLAATAMSNPAYKAVLDSSPSSNSSWEMMKEILLCRVNFKNDTLDRRIILYLNDCGCGRKYCRENAAYLVKNQLKKVSLKDAAVEFLIEYGRQQTTYESSEIDAGLVGHVHLNKTQAKDLNISMQDVLEKCQDTVNSFRKKKKVGHIFKRIVLSFSECCSFRQSSESNWYEMPCLKFFWKDASDSHLERTSHILANIICPVLLETIIKGDPRVSTVNIIWISPDTMTWIRNPCKGQKGELALDVVLEKEAVKQSGDAWRIVMDYCLPVIHLIDTRRSIPYAIKQVQELLGISCAFEQAVQRLSTSVTMVTKGVLKEHLILLANSMTCAGNLVGFNTGGIKTLSRSLNVQVPFTEATLFTPKKCFERAAEKCHVDSLSSIVGSCSWGKHVAVGTGSAFDLFWDLKEVGLKQQDGVDIYNFLHLVRSISKGQEMSTACLGAEIDDLELDDENMELGVSPEHISSFGKPVFEDSAEFDTDIDNQKMEGIKTNESSWEKVSSFKVESSGGWERVVDEKQDMEKARALTRWGTPTIQTQDLFSTREPEEASGSAGWDAMETGNGHKQSGSWSGWGKKTEEPAKASWGEKSGEPAKASWGEKSEEPAKASWGKKSGEPSKASWGEKSGEPAKASWGEKSEEPAKVSWGEKSEEPAKASWGKKSEEPAKTSWGKKSEEPAKASWGEKSEEPAKASWGKKSEEPSKASWSEKDGQNMGVSATVAKPSGWSSWVTDTVEKGEMLSTTAQKDSSRPGGWGVVESQNGERAQEDSFSGWNVIKSGETPNQSGSWASFGKKVKEADETGWSKKEGNGLPWGAKVAGEQANQSKPSSAWVSSNDEVWDKSELQSPAGQPKDSPINFWSSDKNITDEQSNQSASTHGWGSPKVGGFDNSDSQSQWGQQKRYPGKRDQNEGSHGWGSSNAGEWKNKKNRPPRSVGGFNDDNIQSGTFTATRQRLDMFTTEEQDILLDVEPIMQSIRRIMHQSRYNDGDPLSADDQSYIIDNVFNYHPDKTLKMGAGIDYVMVSKHSSFQESRCFYIVSTDGRKEDFSYRKCLDSFVRGKYPDKAEDFNAKYFKKPQPRPGWNRERSLAPEEAATGWNRERSHAPEVPTPENREHSLGPEEAATGWNMDRSLAPEEATPENRQ
ncbi:unnamed protein product [Ilex paraguariensis]|uniref:DNA-directed RNA polymerase subunit n=1 Tax=Ilex paraguariensis TaxID=185542 RepID=A0ABC8TNK5_9AQUA